MKKGIYISTIEPYSGKSLVSLGILRMMLSKSSKVGYYRPVINKNDELEEDNHIKTAIHFFKLDTTYKDCYSYTQSEIIELISEGKEGEIIQTIINHYKRLEKNYDYILVEGSDFSSQASIAELDINALIAKNLNLPVMVVASGRDKSVKDLINGMQIAHQSYATKEVDVIGLIANKVNKEELESIREELKDSIPSETLIDVIPKIDFLANPTLKEVVQQLNADVLFGEQFLDNTVSSFSTGAMQLRNYLTRIDNNSLVITPGDRADIILGALQAHASKNYPNISGIVLTGGLIPEDAILRLIEGLQSSIPIISVKEGTFKTSNNVGAIQSEVDYKHEKKILLSLDTFDTYVNSEELSKRLASYSSDKLTPNMFQYNLLQRTRQERKHIVLPEGSDSRILKATRRLQILDIVDLTLLGDEGDIKRKANQIGVQIDWDKIQIIDPENTDLEDQFTETLYQARKHKGLTETTARDLAKDVSYFGTLMIHNGLADGMVSGAVHTTMHTIKPSLQLIKTKPGVSVVSSVFFMCLSDRVTVMGDCAVNPNPNAEQLAEIAISSAKSAHAFGIQPRVAMLSYSSGASGKGEDVEMVRKATQLVKERDGSLKIEGPIQYDAAVDMSVAKNKLPDSEVAGKANVFIFPDLNTGNNTYKAVQRETGALAIGPMLQGLNKPVNDLSRGCTVDDVFNTILLTAIQAQDE
ncbi:MAG: phosphate acetyltransferase [Flavobacteriaceae bacterium]|nr:phosphate acetyltransferase [Flavobacteriaceae bacterium]|tara:strand:+ start:12726 stop:14819 length:2094 start_codon:yes stop_codon:yes gene_type:complete